MTKRRKAAALPAATSMEEAVKLLGRFAVLDAEVEARKARVDAAIASLRSQAAELDAPAEAEMKAIFLALKPWWAVSADEVTGGKRKSAELAGCLIGHRMTNPKLVYPTPEAVAIEKLHALGYQDLLRVKTELDKQAIIRALLADANAGDAEHQYEVVTGQAQLLLAGFDVSQKEEFFIDRLPPKASAVEVIADPAAEQVPA